MKKCFLLLLISFFCFSTSYAITIEEIEDQLGVDFETADASTLKTILQLYDIEMTKSLTWYDDLKQTCYSRLIAIGEEEWVNQFSGLDETNLSAMSYSNLIDLKNKINLAIWNSAEWQEVTVPMGTWKVGEDIPAGHWTVKCHPDTWATRISWGDHLDDNGESISYWGRYSIGNTVHNPNNETFDPIKMVDEYSFVVQDGDYIEITYGAAIFMPYVGKNVNFGFK